MNKKLSKIEIIKETANYYNSNNRGYNETLNVCLYYDTQTKNMCAVGRCLSNPKKLANKYNHIIVLFENKVITFRSLKSEYRIKDKYFWKKLQIFHDTKENWNKKGLSTKGKVAYSKLKKFYKHE